MPPTIGIGVGIEIAIALRSECGRRRRNEDAARVLQDDGRWLSVLADGAGGHRDGAEAARCVVAQLEAALHRPMPAFEPGVLTGAVLAAHERLRAAAGGLAPADDQRMHSTIVALWIDARHGALWAHVGDSRLYRARGGRVELLTVDDSVVQRLVDAGLMTPAQASSHPRKNELIAALGIAQDVQPHTSMQATPIAEGDAFLLCSDGWWTGLDEACIAGTLAQSRSPDEWLDAMGRRIAASADPHQDNYSAIAVWLGDAGEVTRPRARVRTGRPRA